MRQREVTVAIGAVVVLLLGLGVLTISPPYVVFQPGPTQDTLGTDSEGEAVIAVTGLDPAEPAGELHLTTVSVHRGVTLADVVAAWFSSERAVVPEEFVFPPTQSREEIDQRNQELFSRSQGSAEAAALRYLDYPSQVAVMDVQPDSPAEGALVADDVITEVDGVPVGDVTELQREIRAEPAGATRTIGYLRDGEPGEVEVTTAVGEDGSPLLGVMIAEVFDAPFELTIQLDGIGGPSAGLMFALGVIDKLDPADLTGGEIIAGTGSIDPEGNVGPVGGVPQKLVAARELGAEVFLVPAGNCAEAAATAPAGLTLARVETLDDAVTALADLRSDREPTVC